ncbi:hypothetical protein ES288_A05G311700v1 [Gossypium darwinii]|uniref:Uncharacterized protein n=1 Tax=Gossypium darwinii TaxID=34276 RepID=A0A5D2GM68_GOSDA|nr:hypothetical protein ES288_A05G311700v1 [Gossypium darwinii]
MLSKAVSSIFERRKLRLSVLLAGFSLIEGWRFSVFILLL